MGIGKGIRYAGGAIIVLGLVGSMALFFAARQPLLDLKEKTFTELTKLRQAKKREIIQYYEDVHTQALDIRQDQTLLSYFRQTLVQSAGLDMPSELALDQHYVKRYGNFYDILFVDTTGYVVHSIKKESDYRKNLFESDLFSVDMVARLRENRDEYFIDYRYYRPSSEPSAFFAIAIHQKERHLGWIILQCAVNRTNVILSDRHDPTMTREVYLVNRENLMLTESRFLEDNTILRQRVDTQAVRDALINGAGERIIEDYRGLRVFSSYEKFDLFGTTWVIIAEIDEDEVITEHYRRYRPYFQDRILDILGEMPHPTRATAPLILPLRRVDMNEYAKADSTFILQTRGVAACTAVGVLMPGAFGYLVHLSPADAVYRAGGLAGTVLGHQRSDFLGEIIGRIRHFSIVPYQLRQLRFVIVAPHAHSFAGAIDKILDHGVELANITVLYNPHARYVNVNLDISRNTVAAVWYGPGQPAIEFAADVPNLGTVVKAIIGYDT